MRAHPDWGPTDCEKAAKALSDAMEKLAPEMMQMRARMPGQQPAWKTKKNWRLQSLAMAAAPMRVAESTRYVVHGVLEVRDLLSTPDNAQRERD